METLRLFGRALRKTFEDCGLSMAGAVAFSFVLSLFPFCIFLGALASTLGGREFAADAVTLLFEFLPERVAVAFAPQVKEVMGQTQYGLVTVGGFIALFFATGAIESLRAAMNTAYRVTETRSYAWCLLQSSAFVFASALGALALAVGVIVGPVLATTIEAPMLKWLMGQTYFTVSVRYGIVVIILLSQLFSYHLWLAAGRRSIRTVLPGVLLSVVLWLAMAALYSRYLDFNDYSRFYAGLTQLLSALIFFQVTAMIIIIGAELNRALDEEQRARV